VEPELARSTGIMRRMVIGNPFMGVDLLF
jgi:hypothetical protein